MRILVTHQMQLSASQKTQAPDNASSVTPLQMVKVIKTQGHDVMHHLRFSHPTSNRRRRCIRLSPVFVASLVANQAGPAPTMRATAAVACGPRHRLNAAVPIRVADLTPLYPQHIIFVSWSIFHPLNPVVRDTYVFSCFCMLGCYLESYKRKTKY